MSAHFHSFTFFAIVHLANFVRGNCPAEGTAALNASYNAEVTSIIQGLVPLGLFNIPESVAASPTVIDSNASNLTLEDLRYYNNFAAAMYCSYTLESLTCCPCRHFNGSVTNYTIFSNDTIGTKALVIYHQGTREIVISYRGSVPLANSAFNLAFLQVDVAENIKIHVGWYISVMSLYYRIVFQIVEWLKMYPGTVDRIVLTGHSMGGSMAQLTAFFFSQLNQFPKVNLALVTFGASRSGNKGFVDFMNKLNIPTARVANRADIVPHIVPVLGLNPLTSEYYLHFGQEIWLNGTDIHFCALDKYEDPNCSNQLDPLYSFIDHFSYLGVDYLNCGVEEGLVDILTTPLLGPPSQIIPALPQKISDTVQNIEQTIIDLLYPLLG